MQMSIDKKKMTATIALVLMLASVTLIASVPFQPVQAQQPSYYTDQSINVPAGVTPDWTITCVAYLSFRPAVIGVGQDLLVNMWLGPSQNTGRVLYINKTRAYEIIITKPDGTKVTLLPPGITTSVLDSWLQYVTDVVGEHKIMFNFLGTYFPPYSGAMNDTQYWLPCQSAEYTFTVQADMVPSWPPSPLPTEYWTYPVDFHNREWYVMMGSWPGTGYNFDSWGDYWNSLYPDTNPVYNAQGMFTPLVQGPNSAHVLRISNDASGGIYGGTAGITGQFAAPPTPDVVYQGKCYDTRTMVKTVLINGTYREQPTSCAVCFDLRTGEMYYAIPTADGGVTPTMVMYDRGTSTQSDTETYTVYLMAISSSRLYRIDPFSGSITMNVSISGLPGTTFSGGSQTDGYIIGIQNLGSNASSLPGGQYRLINWTTTGTSTNIASRVISNTSYARSSLPSYIDWNVGLGTTLQTLSHSGVGYGCNVTGFNALTGAQLWTITYGNPSYAIPGPVADNGKFSIWTKAGPGGGRQVAWYLDTGKLAWESETTSYPWAASGFSVYGVASAYGLLFRCSYAGIYAFNWTDGSIAWFCPRYAKAAFESPYTEYAGGAEVYPGQTLCLIADGKVFIYDGEHSPQQPRTRGWSLYAINVTTGKIIWTLPIGGNIMFGTPPSTGPIIDGYLYFPSTTGDTYIIGKGKSATTVTASPKTIANGAPVLIEGTVLDQSPAQPNTPCVSKDSMTTQMSYLHLQYSITGLWGNETITGVPVTLSAIGSDGTYYDIGTATTDGYYGTFSMAWTPPKQDTYKIMANFAADDSYGSSGAATAVTVGPAPEPIESPPATEPTDFTPIYYGIAAAAIAIILAVAIAVLLLRKR